MIWIRLAHYRLAEIEWSRVILKTIEATSTSAQIETPMLRRQLAPCREINRPRPRRSRSTGPMPLFHFADSVMPDSLRHPLAYHRNVRGTRAA